MDLSLLIPWDHDAVAHVLRWRERPPDGPACGASSFFVFPSTRHGPATCTCDATAVSKGFRRLRAGHDIFSRGNQDLWTAIQEASAQRDITVQWIASHEENTMDSVVATTAWFIGLSTLAEGVAEGAADMCDYPDTVPALTSWVEGKSWAIRHRAALTTLDAIEKDPIAQVPPPRRVKPTLVDLKAASEHEVCESGNSVTCCRCGQRAPRRPAPLERWLQSPCVVTQHHPVW